MSVLATYCQHDMMTYTVTSPSDSTVIGVDSIVIFLLFVSARECHVGTQGVVTSIPPIDALATGIKI